MGREPAAPGTTSGAIVSLLPAATELLFELGLGQRVSAVSHECDWPPTARALPRVTRSRIDSQQPSAAIDQQVRERASTGQALYEIDQKAIARHAPGLIITQAECDVCAVSLHDVLQLVRHDLALRETLVLELNPQSLEELLRDVRRIADVAQAGPAAEQLVAAYENRIARIEKTVAAIPANERPRVVCIEWVEPLMVAGNWTPQLVTLAGGVPGLAKTRAPSRYASWDDVQRFDPQVLVISPCGFDLARSREEARILPQLREWKSLAAVQQQRVYVVDGNAYLNRCGPRLVDSLELLAHLIHPRQFPVPPSVPEGEAWERLPG